MLRDQELCKPDIRTNSEFLDLNIWLLMVLLNSDIRLEWEPSMLNSLFGTQRELDLWNSKRLRSSNYGRDQWSKLRDKEFLQLEEKEDNGEDSLPRLRELSESVKFIIEELWEIWFQDTREASNTNID